MDRNFRSLRSFFDYLARPALIAADEFEVPVDDHLRCIDTSAAKPRRVGALPLTVFVRGVWIRPSNTVPIVHVFTEHDEFSSANWLRLVEPLQQGIGRSATGTALG